MKNLRNLKRNGLKKKITQVLRLMKSEKIVTQKVLKEYQNLINNYKIKKNQKIINQRYKSKNLQKE